MVKVVEDRGGWCYLHQPPPTSTILHNLQSKTPTLRGKHKQYREIGYCPCG